MQETNKLSYDDTYLMVFDGGSQALVHTDKFAQQKGFAQLAMDAGAILSIFNKYNLKDSVCQSFHKGFQ